MRMPDFLVIGAAKAGTSTLVGMLADHPAVFVPEVPEPGWWAWREDGPLRRWRTTVPATIPVRDAVAYGALFADAGADQRCVDVSPIYLESAVAVAAAPEVGVIATLRDPAERAWSAYWMHRRDGVEARAVADAFGPDEHRLQVGFYGRLLRPWFERFGSVHVMFVEEWTGVDASARFALADALGVDREPWEAPPARANVGGVPRSDSLERLGGAIGRRLPARLADGAKTLRDRMRQPLPELPDGLRGRLNAIYAQDREELRDLLGREVPWG